MDCMAIVVLLIAVLLLFIPVLRHPQDLLYPTFSPHSDVTVIHWPKAHLMAQAWQSTHALPLWTPANLSGMPLAANQLAMRFYPPAWLALFLPINPVLNLLFVFHLFWGGLGVYWLLRAGFELHPIPAVSGALTFALGGKLLAHLAGGHVSLVGAMAWMPWALLGTHQLLHAGRQEGMERWRWAVLTAVALAMQIATHTLITLYTGYFLVAYVAWQIISNFKFQISNFKSQISNFQSLFLPLFAIPLLAALLGAAQWLPLVELSRYSNRSLSLAQAGEYALTPLTLLIGLFLPITQGGHETVIYLGLVPLILAVLGVGRADRRSWFLAGVVIVAALFALGSATPLFELAYRWLPGMSWVRTPARAFLPASLALAILAGLGMQRLARDDVRWSTPLALSIGLFTLALGLGLVVFFGQTGRAALGLVCFPSLALLVIGLAVRRYLAPRLAWLGLSLLLFVDLASFDLTLIRFVSPAEAFAQGRAVAEYLAAQPGLFRTYSPSYSLPSHVAAQADLQTADGVEPVHLASYDKFMALAGGYGDESFSVTIPSFPPDRPLEEAFRNTQPDLRLLGLLNVEYLVAAFPMNWPGLTPMAQIDGLWVYRNQHMLPRAWVASPSPLAGGNRRGVDAAGDWATQWATLADQASAALTTGEDLARVTFYAPDRIEVEARPAADGMLVLAEIWYPGWQATVDGKAQPVERVAGILRGVQLARGTHQVILVYDPASARWGAWLSLAGIAGLVGWGGWRLWRRWQTRPTREH
jgi:hypothetical protein